MFDNIDIIVTVYSENNIGVTLLSDNIITADLEVGRNYENNYEKLINLPYINNVELKGNKTTSDLGLVDKSVSDLLNYYLKSETYSKTEVNTIVSNINQFRALRLDVRPEVGEEKIIYLIPKSGGVSPDIHDEWLWINNSWELIGNTQIDLSEYAKIFDINSALVLKQNKIDNSLVTTNKNVVEAINEIRNSQKIEWGI